VQKGFIHGRETWPKAMAMAKRGRGWHRRRARVNSRLAKRVKNTRFNALCVWATRSPIGHALQTLLIRQRLKWHVRCCLICQRVTDLIQVRLRAST
jgi:hypothetical protein